MSSCASNSIPALAVQLAPTILFGFGIIGVLIVGFVVWAAYAPLAEAVVASGIVKVDTSRKQIQHLEGGIVKEILVRDGDRVAQGDVLVRLDETRAAASVAILQDGLNATLAQEARLLAERDDLAEIDFSGLVRGHEEDPKITEFIKSQTVLWDARKSAREGEVQILQKQIAQLKEDIRGYAAKTASHEKQLEFVRDELGSVQELRRRGLSGKQRVLELEREAARLEGERAELESQIGSKNTEISRKRLEVLQVAKNFRQSVVDELKKVQAELNDYRERLSAAEHVHGQTELRAPVDGVVVGSGVHTVGGVIPPGATLLEVVPENDRLVVEARIDPQDIDKVSVGLPAAIRLTAFNQRTTPELVGRLTYVSADSLIDVQSGTSHFLARVEVGEDEVVKLRDKQLLPGMLAEVFIRTGERTMADYLIQPLRDSFRRAWLEE